MQVQSAPHLSPHFSVATSKVAAAYSAPPCVKRNSIQLQNLSLDSQTILVRASYSIFKEKLKRKYHPKVVDKLFAQVVSMNRKALTPHDRKRLESWCHFLTVQAEITSNLKVLPKNQQRILKRYFRYTEKEAYRACHAKTSTCIPDHEQIQKCRENASLFIQHLPSLIDHFGEDLCHRMLTKLDLFPSAWLVGETSYPTYSEIKQLISTYYEEEISLRQILDTQSYDELKQQSEHIKTRIEQLKDYPIIKELFTQLAVKTGQTQWLRGAFAPSLIKKQAELFEVSREGEEWANQQEKLSTLAESGGVQSLNSVYFLKSPEVDRSSETIAVFKASKSSSAFETLIYDASILFGLESAFAPTKIKSIKEMDGSLQTFQKGMFYSDFEKRYFPKIPQPRKPEYFKPDRQVRWALGQYPVNKQLPFADAFDLFKPYPQNRRFDDFKKYYLDGASKKTLEKLPSLEEINATYKKTLYEKISIEDYLKAALGVLIFGNRDMHSNNCLLVPKDENEESYRIVMFDNEMCFYPSNYVILDHNDACHLPVRNALLSLPHADIIIAGELKDRVVALINSYPTALNKFYEYLYSSKGRQLQERAGGQIITESAFNAFQERIQVLVQQVNSRPDFTYRELFYEVFPLYQSFLSLVKLFYPQQPEGMVGYHSADELCDMAIADGYMDEQAKDQFIQKIKTYAGY